MKRTLKHRNMKLVQSIHPVLQQARLESEAKKNTSLKLKCSFIVTGEEILPTDRHLIS